MLTKEAKEKHWEALRAEVEALGVAYTHVLVPSKSSIANVWKIYDAALEHIAEGDEIHIDVTHAFRYLPMLLSQAMRYAQQVHGVQLGGVWYGNFEGSTREISSGVEKRLAPIEDLSALLLLDEWTRAFHDFNQHGSVASLADLALQRISPILAATKGRDQDAKALKRLVKKLEAYAEACQMCRGRTLIEGIDYAHLRALCEQASTTLLPPLRPLIAQLRRRFIGWEKGEADCAIRAARWCFEKGMHQQSMTLLQEGLITWQSERSQATFEAHAPSLDEKKRRQLVSSLLNCEAKRTPPEQWNEPLKSARFVGERVREALEPRFIEAFRSLPETRNDINHAGFVPQPFSPKNLRARLEASLELVEDTLGLKQTHEHPSARQ